MSTWRAIQLVAGRELFSRLRNKGLVIGTLVTMAVVSAGLVFAGQSEDDSIRLGVVADDVPVEVLRTTIRAQQARVELAELADRQAAEEAVDAGELPAALVDRSTLVVGEGTPSSQQATLRRVATVAMRQAAFQASLSASGLAGGEIARVLAAPEPLAVVRPSGEEADVSVDVVLAVAMSILLISGVMGATGLLLTGANEEKSNRVVEVLLGKVRPWHLLTGKLVAVIALALLQLLLVLGAALVVNGVVGVFELPSATPGIVVLTVVMLIIGLLLFGGLFLAAGSLATSVEHAQSAAMPLQMGVLGAAAVVFAAVLPSPNSLLAQVLSFVPPTAPFAVPGRVALGAMPAWQVAIAIAVMLVATWLSVRLAGRLYSAALLAGDKLTWRDALRAEPVR